MKTGTYKLNIAVYKKAEEIAEKVLLENLKPETFFKEYGVPPEKSEEVFHRVKRMMALNALRYQIDIDKNSEEHEL